MLICWEKYIFISETRQIDNKHLNSQESSQIRKTITLEPLQLLLQTRVQKKGDFVGFFVHLELFH